MEKLNIEREENFIIECIEYLNTGDAIFNVGEKINIKSSVLIEMEENETMRVYHNEDQISLCDFEIENYFKLN